jgi:hypothetical protein
MTQKSNRTHYAINCRITAEEFGALNRWLKRTTVVGDTGLLDGVLRLIGRKAKKISPSQTPCSF